MQYVVVNQADFLGSHARSSAPVPRGIHQSWNCSKQS